VGWQAEQPLAEEDELDLACSVPRSTLWQSVQLYGPYVVPAIDIVAAKGDPACVVAS
jgi:hypothetical protein